ncbi:MAG: single-stranded DNA-binding protein [Sphaerochaeta sp.]|nr:single-stranded DNA-binding protein [Sphaerochaeta sp.]
MTFLVKDLFKGYLWNRIPKGDRLLLGSLFLSYVGRNDRELTVIKKGASGQQMYQKTQKADTALESPKPIA